jgi:FkbM family methyltransferase
MNRDWIINIESQFDPRMGIRVRSIESGNDGDVCNSCVTHELLQSSSAPFCMDIGVDEGWWSFFVVDKHPRAIVHSFEPNPVSYNKFKSAAAADSRIIPHNVAMSDYDGYINFNCEGGQSHSREITGETIAVACGRIDKYIPDCTIDLIKIDTEGHDITILKTLEPYYNKINSIIFEFTTYWYGTTRDECIERSYTALQTLRSAYPYMYILSRRGDPYLIDIHSADLKSVAERLYNAHSQVDILVSRNQIQSLPIRKY